MLHFSVLVLQPGTELHSYLDIENSVIRLVSRLNLVVSYAVQYILIFYTILLLHLTAMRYVWLGDSAVDRLSL